MDVILVVIDSFGIGALPDAAQYGDEGANTALHICESVPGEKWPFLRKLGLGNASSLLGNRLPGCPAEETPAACYGVMAEKSPGKDTTTGHWEIAGIVLEKPFSTFPPEYPSFPKELTDSFLEETSCGGLLGNCAASGTEIIQRLGQKHMESGFPIIYTSSDSVLQIAAHEDIMPVDELYEICGKARKICDRYMVGRVIARPFTGSPESGFTRTERRHDFSIALPGKTVLDMLSESGVKTVGVGKIGDIFNLQGLDESHGVKGNRACLEKLFSLLGEGTETGKNGEEAGRGNAGRSCAGDGFGTERSAAGDGFENAGSVRPGAAEGKAGSIHAGEVAVSDGSMHAGEAGRAESSDRFIFVNLVDTDMNFGHRRDVKGYHDAVASVDEGLAKAESLMEEGDVLIVTADHGCDPTFRGSDHTREYVPLLAYTKGKSPEQLFDMVSDMKKYLSPEMSSRLQNRGSAGQETAAAGNDKTLSGPYLTTAGEKAAASGNGNGRGQCFGITDSFSFAASLVRIIFDKHW